MRCAQCGTSIRHEPFWMNGMAFCSLECSEENGLVTDDGLAGEAHASGLHALFGADDDDDY